MAVVLQGLKRSFWQTCWRSSKILQVEAGSFCLPSMDFTTQLWTFFGWYTPCTIVSDKQPLSKTSSRGPPRQATWFPWAGETKPPGVEFSIDVATSAGLAQLCAVQLSHTKRSPPRLWLSWLKASNVSLRCILHIIDWPFNHVQLFVNVQSLNGKWYRGRSLCTFCFKQDANKRLVCFFKKRYTCFTIYIILKSVVAKKKVMQSDEDRLIQNYLSNA